MKVTILGSSGQIGAYLTEYLKNKGHIVVEFDIANADWQDMTRIPNINLHDALHDTDFCFFLAFDVGGSRYLKKYQHTYDFINNNTRLMANGFDYLQRYKIPFVFASSQMSNMSYSPYGVLKKVGELYTKSLEGLIVKFWNVYGIEKDYEKSHVITDFIRKGFETGVIDMLTDGEEEREFLFAEDCCEALETIMLNYKEFRSDDDLHITSFSPTKIKDIASIIQGQFNLIGKYDIKVVPSEEKDTVQMDKKNRPNTFITKWWFPKTTIDQGIAKVFNEMKNDWI
jgi:nucleoside-diphosphate-sugar epimerase